MRYYRIKGTADNIRIYKNGRDKGFLIANELYTPKEYNRLMDGAVLSGRVDKEQVYTVVDIKKTRTYWFFGARFEDARKETICK